MGLCISCDAAAVAAAELAESSSTAKVIFPDGRLKEHCGRATVRESRVLVHKDLSPPSAFFLCSADDLDEQGRVAPLLDNDELEAGQIYFVLPAQMLKSRLVPEEMAKLAVMAARAITEAGGVIEQGNPCEDLGEEKKRMKKNNKAVPSRRSNRRKVGARGRDFSSDLTVIPECYRPRRLYPTHHLCRRRERWQWNSLSYVVILVGSRDAKGSKWRCLLLGSEFLL